MIETDGEARLRRDLNALVAERSAATTDKDRGRILGKMVELCWQYERLHGEYSSSETFAAAMRER